MSVGLVDSTLFNIQSVLVRPIITVGITFLLFGGGRIIIFFLLHFLWTRPNMINRKSHVAWIACLFVMATATSFVSTASVVMDSVVFFRVVQTQDLAPFITYIGDSQAMAGIAGFTNIGYVVTNCIADSVLIHRLYTIWGSTTRVIAVPVLASVVANAFGFATGIMQILAFNPNIGTVEFSIKTANFQLGYYATNAAVNSMITLMIAGRIWWTARDARRAISNRSEISKKFRTVVAMVLESGMIYPTVLVIHVAFSANASKLGVFVNLTPAITLVAGMAPTFLIMWSNINRVGGTKQ
ncbi:hypothetical protein Moror_1645 [Moniliophthora roreri MCA 2997]|uniref:G protein-coupled receptor n=1 Tax=Moniliophthora roreri (strain MCA 2997) TaxID=1381753 RepID=V2XIG6_MONRO|nr:hypothetical protein Moror_1645 [Moniliophthora roreri MCA 2997]